MRIPSGVTDQYLYFVAVDATDMTTRETGLSSFTVYRSRNGGAAAAYATPTVNETDTTNMPGVYELLLDEDMTIDSGDDSQEVCLHITHAGMAPVTRTFELYRPKLTAGETLTVSSGGGALSAAERNSTADAIMVRASSNWEASAPTKSLGTAVMTATHRIEDDAGTFKVYRSDGTTPHASATITPNASKQPIEEIAGLA